MLVDGEEYVGCELEGHGVNARLTREEVGLWIQMNPGGAFQFLSLVRTMSSNSPDTLWARIGIAKSHTRDRLRLPMDNKGLNHVFTK